MKQNAVRILLSLLVFGISFFIATLTKLEIVENAILLAFLIHWLFFIPAYLFKTEKFFDLTGSLTYISIMVYVVYTKNNLQEELGSIILASLVLTSYDFMSNSDVNINLYQSLFAAIVAFITALISIKIMMQIIQRSTFNIFIIYRVLLGFILLYFYA